MHFSFGDRRRKDFSALPPAVAPNLALLTHVESLEPAQWIVDALPTFGRNVGTIMPGQFSAYARIFHPFGEGPHSSFNRIKWATLASSAGYDLSDPAVWEDFAYNGVPNAQSHTGDLDPNVIEALIPHLRHATASPGECYFALWEGFAGTSVPHNLEPKLEVPWRSYHVFRGPLEAALTSFSSVSFAHQSANLWWPADHGWCVATEVDHAWTYVGGSLELVDSLLGDQALDAMRTSADSW